MAELTIVLHGTLAELVTSLSEGYAVEHPNCDASEFVSGCLSNYFARLFREAMKGE